VRVVERRAQVREWSREARETGKRTALVPTMGYLHAGHLSLIEIARRNAERVAVSIFVNPLQFGPAEDLDRYPRDLERDLRLAREAGADLVFTPPTDEMYPRGEPWVVVVPERGADRLDGASRPGHFRGVLTVVAKLLGIFQPDVAVFGQKDLQQLALIRRMVADLDIPVEIVAGPIVREADGLAMSSRNVYLSPEERGRALALSRAIAECRALLASGEHAPAQYLRALRSAGGAGVELEYGEVVDPETLEPVDRVVAGVACAIAARVGNTRLIDNAVLGT
jgi:pantoate--beta-alanine ligase